MFRQPGAGRCIQLDGDVLIRQLCFQFENELVDHVADGRHTERLELDDGVQAVAELGAEQLLDVLHRIRRVILRRKPHAGTGETLSAGVGGHDNNDVAEIGLASVVVGQRAVVHHLQQQVEHVRVRLLDLIHQQHGVRMFGDGLG